MITIITYEMLITRLYWCTWFMAPLHASGTLYTSFISWFCVNLFAVNAVEHRIFWSVCFSCSWLFPGSLTAFSLLWCLILFDTRLLPFYFCIKFQFMDTLSFSTLLRICLLVLFLKQILIWRACKNTWTFCLSGSIGLWSHMRVWTDVQHWHSNFC